MNPPDAGQPRGSSGHGAPTMGPGGGTLLHGPRTGPASGNPGGEAMPMGPLTLDPLAGPPIAPIEVGPAAPKTLGRSSSCETVLPDESVSRRHAQIAFRDGLWFVTDLGSTHGTLVNGTRVTAQSATPIKAGDLIVVGPWTFRVRSGPTSHAMNSLVDDSAGAQASRQRVERVQERELAAITQQRLNLLMDCSAAVVGVEDERALGKIMLDAVVQGTGFPRAALLRDTGSDVEVICEIDPMAPEGVQRTFSKSLIQEARKGEMVKLVVEDAGANASASIMMLKIQTALCAPVKVGEAVLGFLYLDSRAGEQGGPGLMRRAGQAAGGPGGGGGVPHDAATFVQAIARLCSLALGNLARAQLEKRQAELVRDLSAAREAQKMIMPADSASISGVRYAMRMKPGRMVAGDLFDVVPLDENRVAIFLGDVAGKGISAAILMATAQTHLNICLRQHADPAKALAMTNQHICAHATSNKFISLFLGVFDARSATLSYVDAGHGYWLLAHADGSVLRGSVPGEGAGDQGGGGIPLGIDPEFPFTSRTITLPKGSRLVVFSDGVAEQPGPEGEQFSVERAIAALSSTRDVEQDARTLFDAVLNYAKTDSLADDTTVASVQFL